MAANENRVNVQDRRSSLAADGVGVSIGAEVWSTTGVVTDSFSTPFPPSIISSIVQFAPVEISMLSLISSMVQSAYSEGQDLGYAINNVIGIKRDDGWFLN